YNSRVVKLDSSGHQLWIVGAANGGGQSGTANGQFDRPYEGRLSPGGTKLYVADGFNHPIDELNTSDGSFVRKWGPNGGDGSTGTTAGSFNQPVGLGVDPVNGNVYVADFNNNRVEEFDPTGVFVAAFGYGVTDGSNAFEVCTSGCQTGIAGNGN